MEGLPIPNGSLPMLIVTGASGFIGANLVRHLNLGGVVDILAVDDYQALSADALGMVDFKSARWVRGLQVKGCLDMHSLDAWLDRHGDQVTGILHMGACSDTTVTDRAYVMGINLQYTQRLFAWCAARAVPLIYASSAATYGDGNQGYDDEADPHTLKPLNLYGESKQLMDLWALEQKNTPPRWAGLKFFNVYGPMESHKGRMASVVFHGYHQILQTGAVRLFESHKPGIAHGGQRRDFIHVDDVARAVLHFLRTPASDQAPNGLYNVGTGQARSFEDLARATFAAMKRTPDIRYIPMPQDLREKYQYFTQATVAKRTRAGASWPTLSLEEGVARYVAWLDQTHGGAE